VREHEQHRVALREIKEMGKWDNKLSAIRSMAGNNSTKEIASVVGTTVPNLHKICHRNGISLPRDPETYRGGGRRKSSSDKLEAAKDLLLNAGYRVYWPDPFGKVNT